MAGLGGGLAALNLIPRSAQGADPDRAQIAITLDLEMSRNFPSWEQTDRDNEKGTLNEETKRYAVEARRRVKEAGDRASIVGLDVISRRTMP